MLDGTKPAWKSLLPVWLLACLILIIGSWGKISGLSGWDPDDQLRLVQIRDFLAGQSWFDTTQYRLNTPDGTSMHWSRITEIPLILIILLLKPLFGQHMAEMIAGSFVPLLLLGVTGYFISDIARKLSSAAAAPVAMILIVISPPILAQFLPMRIDHHSWQIMLASFALWTIFREDKRKNGIMLGLALALWLHISLEGAPLTAVFFAYLGWRWLFQAAYGERLFWTISAFTLGSFLLFFVTEASGFAAPAWCDSISPPHLAAISAAAIIMLLSIAAKPNGWPIRLVASGAAGVAALIALYLLAPKCAAGGFAELDPLVREYWYNNVAEGLPIWRRFDSQSVSWTLPVIITLAGALLLFKRGNAESRAKLGLAVFFTAASLLIAMLVFRAISVACAFAIPILATWLVGLIQDYRNTEDPLVKVKTALIIFVIAMAGPLVIQAETFYDKISANSSKKASKKTESSNTQCQSVASVSALSDLPKGRIIAPFDIGPAILLTSEHSVLASSHHRNNAGMLDQIKIFTSPPEKAEKLLRKRGITHFAICPDESEMGMYAARHPDALWAKIKDGKAPAWLTKMPDMGEGIQIWRVNFSNNENQ